MQYVRALKAGQPVPDYMETLQLVVFRIDEARFALPLASVDRVFPAVEVTSLPGVPPVVMGIINVEGRIVPVLNLRRRFFLPERDITISDQFLSAWAGWRNVVLVVDETERVVEHSRSDILDAPDLTPSQVPFQGAVQLHEGLVLLHDLETVLSLDEVSALDEAMHSVA